jgi:8-oxo-dGTP pyrophosphatase MutT (NUDIX family)
MTTLSPTPCVVLRVRCCSSAGCLVGGAAELRLALTTAVARREMQEETGLHCPELDLLEVHTIRSRESEAAQC